MTSQAMPTAHQSAVNAAKELEGRRTGAASEKDRDAINFRLKLRRLIAENPTAFFRNADTNHNGELSCEEWEQACTDALGKEGLEQDHFAELLRSMFREMDTNNKGTVVLDEFRERFDVIRHFIQAAGCEHILVSVIAELVHANRDSTEKV